MGRQRQRVDRAGVRQLPEGCGERDKMERAGCKVVSCAPTLRTGDGKVKRGEARMKYVGTKHISSVAALSFEK